jgi:hypothetical protein
MSTDDLTRWMGPSRPPETGDLLEREAIRQLPRIYALGVDTRSIDLAISAFTIECVIDGNFGKAVIREYLQRVLEGNARFVATQHHITNQYVAIDGDRALVWSYVLAYHLQPDGAADPDIVVGVQYRDDCVRQEGAWRIACRDSVMQWRR